MFVHNDPNVAYCTAACIHDFNSSLSGSSIVPDRTYFLRFDDHGQLAETDVPEKDQGAAFRKLEVDCLHYLKTGEHPLWEIEGDQRFLEVIARSALSVGNINTFGDYQITADNLSDFNSLLSFNRGSTCVSFFLCSPGDSITSLLGHLRISIRGIRSVSYMTTGHGAHQFEHIVERIRTALSQISTCPEATPEILWDRSSEAFLIGLLYKSGFPTGRLASLLSSIQNSDDNAYPLLKREVISLFQGLTMDEVRAALSLSAYTILPAPSFRDERVVAVVQSAESKINSNFDLLRRSVNNMPVSKSLLGRLARGASMVLDRSPKSNNSLSEQTEINRIIDSLRRKGL